MTSPDQGSDGFGGRLRSLLRGLKRRRAPPSSASQVTFSLMYDRFREILGLNNVTLEMFADLEERLSGRKPFAMEAVAQRIRKAALDVFVMAKDLNQIAAGRHDGLYDALRRINAAIEAELGTHGEAAAGPLVIPLRELRLGDAKLVGGKMASLGEVTTLGLRVPDGFAISTGAFVRFISENDLWRRADRLETILEADGPRALGDACAEVQQAIEGAALPPDLADAILAAHDQCFPEGTGGLAVRSSAVGEDRAASSHAGLYRTRLRVRREELVAAYREVVASAFGAAAVAYRFDHGLTGFEAAMGVGCLRLIEPRCAGILFSRPTDDTTANQVIISATPGLADALAAGEEDAEMLVASADGPTATSALLRPEEVQELVQTARRLEQHFGAPQDIEWVIDQAGALFVVQTRPLVASARPTSSPVPASTARPLLIGGFTACPGVGQGLVATVRSEADLAAIPEGSVLVTRFSSPRVAQVMRRCTAIISDVGSPTGHMSILAREYHVPAIVGLEGATRQLRVGQPVTVDATSRCVFDGLLPLEPRPEESPSLEDSPALQMLRRVARLVTPLELTDPASPAFSPQGSGSLHDLTRFIHEKAFEVMFHYGDLAAGDQQNSFRLKAVLPIDVMVFDVGGGIDPDVVGSSVRPEQIRSVPLRAFLSGLQDERIRWDQPRPVSMRGFLSVLGESITAPPAESQHLGRASYVIASDRYMNFSTKAGYHFSTVDTFCEKSQNKNYVHFRFAGGGADEARRARRVRFLAAVLSALGFKVNARQDLLAARLDKLDEAQTSRHLADLGRLTLCVRQLDMLMSSDAVADQYARFFLAGEWHRF